jgi:hypothetical protein
VLADFASGFLVFSSLAIALFQLAIVLGAPVGEYAYGGQHEGVLPTRFRIASVVSILVMLAIAGHYLAQIGVFSPVLDQDGNAIANWGFVGFFALAALMNNITKSEKEKRVFGSITLAMLLSAILVAL